jgi:hypothetical protein
MVLVIISLITVTVLGVFHTAVTTNKLQKSAFSSWFRLITNENLWHPLIFIYCYNVGTTGKIINCQIINVTLRNWHFHLNRDTTKL